MMAAQASKHGLRLQAARNAQHDPNCWYCVASARPITVSKLFLASQLPYPMQMYAVLQGGNGRFLRGMLREIYVENYCEARR